MATADKIDQEVGKVLAKACITKDMLEQDPCHLPRLKPTDFTKGLVVELRKAHGVSSMHLAMQLKYLAPLELVADIEKCNEKSLQNKANSVWEEYQKLSKNAKKHVMSDFLKAEFQLPKPRSATKACKLCKRKFDEEEQRESETNMAEKRRADDAEPITAQEPKKAKSDGTTQDDPHWATPLSSFQDFEMIKILNDHPKNKSVFVHGKFKGHEEEAVVILEKTPFSEETLPIALSGETKLKVGLKNDIYGNYHGTPPAQVNGIKVSVVYPATHKHLVKYSQQETYLVQETEDDYKKITLPFLEAEAFRIQWVYNILEHKTESERIVYEDPDKETGFILLPDMKWDLKQVNDLYLIAIVHKHGIRSLRDLTAEHLPLLHNILKKGQQAIQEKFDIPPCKLRIYLHYQPSYYHLHIHFTHLNFDAPGSGVERAHLLTDVIEHLEMMTDYYSKKTLSFCLRENDQLLAEFRKAGRVPEKSV
ncbi:m7GpppX diphosphatase-like isoform X1 [Branchiostoma floridae]|uniref:m7GpppX diphosphatase n=2 Tax=Branchiostoma floridae TaxID=7739 RepID=A0A9J7LKT7_BRAFL|nr:m7GpppX diphosphatase-like isoform X1 [Branchiostoma floridae]